MKKLAIIAAAALLLASCTKEDDRYAAEVYTYIVDGERQMRYPLYCLVRLYDTKNLSKADLLRIKFSILKIKCLVKSGEQDGESG